MRLPFLVGRKLYLCCLEASEVGEEYVRWLNDYEVTRYMASGRFPSTLASVREYIERFQGSSTDIIFAIIDQKTEKHVGNVTLNSINWIHRTADTGLMLGQKEFWGKGYAFEAWRLLIEYAFQRLGLRKIVAGAVAENVASIVVLTKLGFKVEGTLRQEFFLDGEYRDGVRLGLLREEYGNYMVSAESDSE